MYNADLRLVECTGTMGLVYIGWSLRKLISCWKPTLASTAYYYMGVLVCVLSVLCNYHCALQESSVRSSMTAGQGRGWNAHVHVHVCTTRDAR